MGAFRILVIAAVFVGLAMLLTCQRGAQTTYVQKPADSQTVTTQKAVPPIKTPTPSERPAEKPTVQERPAEKATSEEPQRVPETPAPPAAPVRTPDSPSDTPKSVPARPGRIQPIVTLGDEVSRGDKNSPRIALTFDAGADASPTPLILSTLARHGVRSTFFLTGKWMESNKQMTRRIIAEGHEIGNHTYSHKRLTELSEGEISREAERVEQMVRELTGTSTKPLLRVPYGARDKRVLAALKNQGYRSIYWDLDSWDAVKANITSNEIEQRVLSKTRNGSIVLMHCGSMATAKALDSLLGKLIEAGYEPVTVSELLGG